MINTMPLEFTFVSESAILLANHSTAPLGYHIQRPSGLKDWMIHCTNAGRGRYVWHGKEYICQRGDMVIFPPNFPHDYSTWSQDRNWEFYCAHFIPDPNWMRWLLVSENLEEPYICHMEHAFSETQMINRFEKLIAHMQTSEPETATHELEALLIVGLQQHVRSLALATDIRLTPVLQYIFEHSNEPINVSMLAELVMLSPSRLAHLFKEKMGYSIMQMLLILRLRHGARLLNFTSLPIGVIAAEAGFQSQFYFSHCFKTYYGMGPREFRRHK